jgi:hypothetical protein
VAHHNFLSVVIVRLYVRPVRARSKPSGCPTGIIPHHAPRRPWAASPMPSLGAAGCLTAGRARNALADLTLPQRLRQLGDVDGDAGLRRAKDKRNPKRGNRLRAPGARDGRPDTQRRRAASSRRRSPPQCPTAAGNASLQAFNPFSDTQRARP